MRQVAWRLSVLEVVMSKINRGGVYILLAALAAAVGSQPAAAHHSFPATYLVDQTVTIEGTVTQFLFRNPHSFVHVMTTDKDGKTETWSIEWAGGSGLEGAFKDHEMLKPGDKVTVVGNPGRDESQHRVRMRSIIRPLDGWKWEGTFG
jgi:hypothetical protein